eukprot:CAMPEP_0170314200 /NCGR_PEP_ID=MMETSP0116_2-20130129/57671_1 /TAXON_ID=400756 /ORGANISM="Durinskia baltica, Strain CSIRO CS-38" /LENGTH=70 /DNA_ID=CAMNT_0010566645 /DNA_START=23 /DNA_END=235 /DNA_ORIENTATION=+
MTGERLPLYICGGAVPNVAANLVEMRFHAFAFGQLVCIVRPDRRMRRMMTQLLPAAADAPNRGKQSFGAC